MGYGAPAITAGGRRFEPCWARHPIPKKSSNSASFGPNSCQCPTVARWTQPDTTARQSFPRAGRSRGVPPRRAGVGRVEVPPTVGTLRAPHGGGDDRGGGRHRLPPHSRSATTHTKTGQETVRLPPSQCGGHEFDPRAVHHTIPSIFDETPDGLRRHRALSRTGNSRDFHRFLNLTPATLAVQATTDTPGSRTSETPGTSASSPRPGWAARSRR